MSISVSTLSARANVYCRTNGDVEVLLEGRELVGSIMAMMLPDRGFFSSPIEAGWGTRMFMARVVAYDPIYDKYEVLLEIFVKE